MADTRTPQRVEADVVALALSDVPARPGDHAPALGQLKALIGGAAPDEVKALRHLLFERAAPAAGIDPDLELVANWRDGSYPYKNLMARQSYEKQKYRLQVELLKLPAWVKDTGQRVVALRPQLGQPRRAAAPFQGRQAHPLKQWKLSPIDLASLDTWDGYTLAKELMFLHTDTSDSPWTVIKSDCKKRARLNAMRYLLHRLPYRNKDGAVLGTVDPLLVGRASLVGGLAEEFTPARTG